MSKHTPGPWSVGYHSSYGLRDGAIVFESETGMNVASCWARLRDVEECDANARLIAVAPKMYELIKDFVYQGPDPGAFWDDASRLLEEIDNE